MCPFLSPWQAVQWTKGINFDDYFDAKSRAGYEKEDLRSDDETNKICFQYDTGFQSEVFGQDLRDIVQQQDLKAGEVLARRKNIKFPAKLPEARNLKEAANELLEHSLRIEQEAVTVETDC